MLDNGAQFSAMSLDFYQRYVKHLGLPTRASADSVAACGRSIAGVCQVMILLEVGEQVVELSMKVIPDLVAPGLIGNDLLNMTTLCGKTKRWLKFHIVFLFVIIMSRVSQRT